MKASKDEKISVVIVGAGPNGVAMANLLGLYGVDTLVIEKSAAIMEFPRAVGIDDEALRLFQTAGLADELCRDIIQNVPLRMFKADGKCFADIRPSIREFGWWRRNIFMQQLAEKTLREGLLRYPHVSLRTSEEVTDIMQDDAGVTLEVRREAGPRYTIRADYVVAADGGRSSMREQLGVKLHGKTHSIKWVVVDVKNGGLEQPCTALNCDPRRPNVCIYLPFNYRRWEFLVYPHENEEEIVKSESIRKLIAPYVADVDAIEIVRARTYTHHSRVADRFLVDRVALVGDAAHLTPPWIGQGLNAGLRDVGNLAWKLAGIINGTLSPEVLKTYDSERRDHAKAMIDLADSVGAMLMPTSRVVACMRDAFFSCARFAPGLRNYVLQMRFKPMPSYLNGVVVPGDSRALGKMIIQPEVEVKSGARSRLDDVLGPWFSIIGWRSDPQATMSEGDRAYWTRFGVRFVQIDRSRSGASREGRVSSRFGTVCVEDVDNVMADWFERNSQPYVLVRPDRYVAAHVDAVGLMRLALQIQVFAPAKMETADVC